MNDNTSSKAHFYDKVDKRKTVSIKKAHEKRAKTSFKPQQEKRLEEKVQISYGKPSRIEQKISMFDSSLIEANAKKILENFDDIIHSSRPLTSKQRSLMIEQIKNLSQELTTERSSRRVGYMNTTTMLTAYVNYFMWWNLIRLTRLFANIGADAFKLSDTDVCLDVGSGPLTVPIAMYLALPQLRKKKLTWYCMDYSQTALSLGEELFLNVAAKLLDGEDSAPWKIIRVKGAIGTPIKEKASLITCANMFNEVIQESKNPPDFLAKKYALSLMSYADTGNKENPKNPSIFVIEPGVPRSSRFIVLLRDAFAKRSYNTVAPCPSAQNCPLSGNRTEGNGKWCNFTFNTENVPAKLQKLSAAAHLTKDRASLSYVFTQLHYNCESDCSSRFRIVSEAIKLPAHHTGFYACSQKGLSLLVNADSNETLKLSSGDIVNLEKKAETKANAKQMIDQKSGAIIQAVTM